MERQEQHIYHVSHARVDSSGRIVIPAGARERHHISEGDTLVVVEDQQGLHVKSLDQAIADAQGRMQQHVVDLNGELFGDEFQYWPRVDAKKRNRR